MASENNQECSKFCLKWDGFHNNLASVFENLRQDEEFVDITLFCDGMKLKAHKMMLSAASPFFRDLLKENPCQHPVFFLRDTSCQDMAAILEFIYRGSVNVSQTQLGSFIQTAELLQIRGLSGEENGKQRESRPASADPTTTPATPPSAPQPPSSPRRPRAAPATPPSKRRRLSATPPPPPPEPPAPPLEAAVKREKEEEPEEVTVHESVVAVGLESMVFSPTQQQQQQQFPAAMTTSTPNMTSAPAPTANPSEEQSQATFDCPVCRAQYKSSYSLQQHLRVHEGRTLCPVCGVTQSRVTNLRRHLMIRHNLSKASAAAMVPQARAGAASSWEQPEPGLMGGYGVEGQRSAVLAGAAVGLGGGDQELP